LSEGSMRMRYDIKHDILYIDTAPNKEVHDTQPLDDASSWTSTRGKRRGHRDMERLEERRRVYSRAIGREG